MAAFLAFMVAFDDLSEGKKLMVTPGSGEDKNTEVNFNQESDLVTSNPLLELLEIDEET